jgi:hypothetical protein
LTSRIFRMGLERMTDIRTGPLGPCCADTTAAVNVRISAIFMG